MIAEPGRALAQLRREASRGDLARLCQANGIELLVAFGSTVHPSHVAPARDLDLAVLTSPGRGLLDVLDTLVVHLGLDEVDLMDLGRADVGARFQALGRGELLHEAQPGMFADWQIQALTQHADTKWLRDLELTALARS